jgi:hypothetical protein
MKNGAGLEKDAELLRKLIVAAGHTVYVESARGIPPPTYRQADVVVFLEIVDPKWFQYGSQFWLVPNSEWYYVSWDQYLPRISRVLCKTRHCYDLWSKRVPADCCKYISFESADFYHPEIPRKRQFLHMFGRSANKNTDAVISAWRNFKLPYPLILLGNNFSGCSADKIRSTPNVQLVNCVPDVTQLLNESMFQICPSTMEGFGHAINEGLGCGAVMITTDAQPMNEFSGLQKELLLPAHEINPPWAVEHCISKFYGVTPEGVAAAAKRAWELHDVQAISHEAREGFENDRTAFRERFATVLQELEPPVVKESAIQVRTTPRDIVLVTTFFRPEYLWCCLEAISRADGGKDKEVWVAHDHHVGSEQQYAVECKDNAAVADYFRDLFAGFRWIDRTPHAYDGNSYNCLELYKEAYGTDARFVYLIEDDILVERDFFRWHEAVQAADDYFASIGRLHTMHPERYKTSDDPAEYVESADEYTSWGVCWKREKLESLMEHCQPEYYRNMTGYIARRFPNSKLNSTWTEQDGLIRRVLMEKKGLTASPCLKRAYHVGVSGYHRPNGYRFTGTLGQRILQMQQHITAGTLPSLCQDFKELHDIDVPRGITPEWKELRKV